MSLINVSSAEELYNSLKMAQGGETIVLAEGDYGRLSLYDGSEPWAAFADTVTIRSADADAMASFSSLRLRGVTNLTIEDVVFDYDAAPGASEEETPFSVRGGSNIAIRNSVFDGDLAEGVSVANDGFGTGHGLYFTNTQGVEVSGNEFFDWKRGAVFEGVTDLVVSGNEVYAIRSDGLDFAAVLNVLIENNYIHDFRGSEATGDHRDMIQFWTASTSRASENVVIRGNILDSAEGSSTQSIFMRNELIERGQAGDEMRYTNFLIEDNLIRNAHIHGIRIGESDGLTIRNNTLLHNAASGDDGGVSEPAIRVSWASENVVVENNVAHDIVAENPGFTLQNNVMVQRDDPALANYYDALFVNADSDDLTGTAELAALPGGMLETAGIGARIGLFSLPEDGVIAQVRAEIAELGDRWTHVYDAGMSIDADGLLDADGARFFWDFGDGVTAEGISVSHTFAAAGDHDVTLRIETLDGAVDETAIRTRIADPMGAQLVADAAGFYDASQSGHAVRGVLDGMVVQTEGGDWVLKLDDENPSVALPRGAGGLFASPTFTIGVRLRADTDADGAGELFRLHNSMIATVTPDGGLQFVLTTREGVEIRAVAGDGPLLDGGWHDLEVRFDGAGDGGLSIIIDGETLAFTAGEGTTQPSQYWGFDLGSNWGRDGFEGEISGIELRNDADADVALFSAPQPQEASDLNAPVPTLMLVQGEVTVEIDVDHLWAFDADDASLTLIDDAHVADGLLMLDGDRDGAVLRGATELGGTTQISIVMDIRADADFDAQGRVLWNHDDLGISISGGAVWVTANTVEKGFRTVASASVDVTDGQAHRLGVTLDQDADELRFYVDGVMVDEVLDLDFQSPDLDGSGTGWFVGGIYGRDMDGEIDQVAMSAEILGDDVMTMAIDDALLFV